MMQNTQINIHVHKNTEHFLNNNNTLELMYFLFCIFIYQLNTQRGCHSLCLGLHVLYCIEDYCYVTYALK